MTHWGEPIKQLLQNAEGTDLGLLRLVEVLKTHDLKDTDYGYSVIDGRFGSMLDFGIVDPVKVARSALQNAASVAMMVLTTEGLVTDIPEEKPAAAPQMPGGGMDY